MTASKLFPRRIRRKGYTYKYHTGSNTYVCESPGMPSYEATADFLALAYDISSAMDTSPPAGGGSTSGAGSSGDYAPSPSHDYPSPSYDSGSSTDSGSCGGGDSGGGGCD